MNCYACKLWLKDADLTGFGKSVRFWGVVWTLLVFSLPLFAQPTLSGIVREPRIEFEHLATGEGLARNTITTILQDQLGFLWIGTTDGLLRYDGYQFKVYTHDPANPLSLSHKHILTVYEDRGGVLWVGTNGGGLNAFHRETEHFVHYQPDPQNPSGISHAIITSLAEDQSGLLWIGTHGGGLQAYHRDTGQFSHYRYDEGDSGSLSSNFVQTLYADRQGNLWIGTLAGGLNRFVPATGKFVRYQSHPDAPFSLSHNTVSAILEDRSGVLWVGTNGGGLNRLDRDTEQFTTYLPEPGNPASLSHPRILALYEDRDGVIWIGTEGGGLNRLIPPLRYMEPAQFFHCGTNAEDPHSLSHNIVSAISADRSGILWVGTTGGGLNKFTHQSETFPHYQPACHSYDRQLSSVVLALYEDQAGILWIGTHGDGLVQFDRNTNQCKRYRAVPGDPTRLGSDIIVAILEDRQRKLWIGAKDGGLYRFDRDAEQFTPYRHDPENPQSISSNNVRVIYEDVSGVLWIGTEDAGLNRFDQETEEFIRYQHHDDAPASLSSNAIWAIYEDRQGTFWIGTDNGLHEFDRQTGQFHRYPANAHATESWSDFHIRSIHEDRFGNLWIGTRGSGLQQFDRAHPAFTRYDQHEELLVDVIYGILEDTQGNLWLSTNMSGIIRLNPQPGTVQQFSQRDGLQSDIFSVGAYHQSVSGEIFFGGINGFNAFYPDDIGKNPHIPLLVVTDFQLAHRSVGIGGDSPLQQAITGTKEIKLAYQEHTLSFEFAALDYTIPEKNQYAYRLEGFDPDWIAAGTRRVVTYMGLAPGKYVFRVKGSNNDGIWNEEGTSLKLIITPPFWKTGWFRLVLVILTLGAMIGGVSLWVRRIEHQKRLLEQQVRERTRTLERQKAQLQASERRYRAVVEDQTELICRFGPDGILTFVNGAYCRYFAKRPEELLGKQFFPLIPETDQEKVQSAIAALSPQTPLKTVEHRVINPEGEIRWQQWTNRAIFDEQGRLLGIQAVGRDTTARKRLEDDLKRAKELAEAANQAKSVFLANMSHELRTPLNAILGFAQILMHSPHLPVTEQEHVATIHRSGQHLLTLINQVLDLAKIEAGHMTLHEQEVDTVNLLGEIHDLFTLKAQQKALRLTMHRADDVPRMICTDAVKLRQILINVVGNALKFTDSGSVTVRVWTPRTLTSGAQATPLRLIFEVEDTGPGMTPEEVETLFTAFTQTQTGQDTQEGTGLGLAISQQFVHLLGGDLRVNSVVGQGTTFSFAVQVGVAATTNSPAKQPQQRVVALAPNQPSYRLLVVDDKPDNRTLLITLLQPVGFDLREATNGQEAVEVWRQWQPHLIWMDLRMPAMNGYEATQEIRKLETGNWKLETDGSEYPVSDFQFRSIIIALSASSFKDELATALARGCDDFLRKPFQEAEVFEMLQKHLGVRFVYAEEQQVAGRRSQVAGEEVLTPEILAALPDDVLAEFRNAVEVIDLDRARCIIDRIRPQNAPLAEGLAELVKGYRFDVLQEWLKNVGQ